jgi:hypothetical protein
MGCVKGPRSQTPQLAGTKAEQKARQAEGSTTDARELGAAMIMSLIVTRTVVLGVVGMVAPFITGTVALLASRSARISVAVSIIVVAGAVIAVVMRIMTRAMLTPMT